jgi:chromosome segregation ATPase
MGNPELEIVTSAFEKSVTQYYKEKIYKKMNREKQNYISKQRKRADYQAIISLKDMKDGKGRPSPPPVELNFEKEVSNLQSKVEMCQDANSNILDSFDVLKVRYAELEQKLSQSNREIS